MRRLFTPLSALSFVLCVGTVLLWVQSQWYLDYLWVQPHHEHGLQITLARSRIWIATTRSGEPDMEAESWYGTIERISPGLGVYSKPWDDGTLGFSSGSSTVDLRDTTYRYIAFPLWLPAGLFGLPVIIRAARKRRTSSGHCSACDYDLRATPDRCPECGAVPSAKIKNSN
jgi:hypothetical protein